jgi:biopolymer transport protein ExbB
MAALAIIAQTAPLIGLLGTVVGFIRTVMLVNSQELVSRAELLDASMESLVATALGLAVAIPVSVMYGSLRVRLERTVVELEAAASQIVGYLSDRVGKGGAV